MSKKSGPVGNPIVLPNGSIAPLSAGYATESYLFLSGQLPFGSDGVLCSGSIGEQTTVCLQNINALLKEAGMAKEHVVKATIWLTDVDDFAGFNQAYVEFFGTHRPARSTTRADLILPGAKVEIEVIAAFGQC